MTKRLLVSLDDDRYEDLRRFAFEKNASMAELVRYALEKTFEDQLDEMLIKRGMEEYAADPSGTVTIQEFMERHGIAVPSRASAKGRTGSRKAAS